MVGDRILTLVKEKKISQKDLALMIGVSESALSRYIKNEREPSIEVMANLATALDTTIDYLTTGAQSETDFDEIYRLVARCAYNLTPEQKMAIIEEIAKRI